MGTGHFNENIQKKMKQEEVPVCNIMGVNIAAVDMPWVLDFFEKNVIPSGENRLSGDYVCVSNVHTTVMAYQEEKYREIQNGGILALPDGGPLSTVGRKRGFSKMNRVTGPDLMQELFQVSKEKPYRHFFYGATEETLNAMKENIYKEFPGIDICGMYSPPFRKLSEKEECQIADMVNSCDADFIWIGLGAPKQEVFMSEHQGTFKGVMIGVGAGFDYFAKNIKRAPKWMQAHNLEWLYRLIQEPKRLVRRYLVTIPIFIWNAMIKGK